jgi:predicted metal-dependent phosphoesterase TrpH
MKLDLHIHTKYSRDGMSSPAKMVRAAKAKGLDGLAITDHNTTRGWEEAITVARQLGLELILGEEIKVYSGEEKRGEVLALFLQEEIPKGDFHTVMDRIREQGAIAIMAHPFDPYRRFHDAESAAKRVHGLEGFNARSPFSEYNAQAGEFARKHKLVMTAGSDAHTKWEVGNAWTEVKADTLEDIRKAILKGQTVLQGKKANHLVHVFSTLAKTKLIGHF